MTTRHIGGKRRRQRGGVSDGALADATNSIVKALQNGGRKRTYRKKGGKKSKRSGGKRSSKRKTRRMSGGLVPL